MRKSISWEADPKCKCDRDVEIIFGKKGVVGGGPLCGKRGMEHGVGRQKKWG